jgi:outer membrane immunogenic protein
VDDRNLSRYTALGRIGDSRFRVNSVIFALVPLVPIWDKQCCLGGISMRRFVIQAAFLLLATGAGGLSAQAADKKPVFLKAPPVAALPPWTGFFIGSHIGLGQGRKQFFDNFPVPDGDLDADVSIRGWLGGFQAGFNYQINWLVLGIESDFSWAGVKKEGFSCFSFGDQVCSADAEWFATVTGRAGVTIGPSLLYGKGGLAWVHDTFTALATCAGSQPRSSGGIPAVCGDEFLGRETRPGWTVGVGIEYPFMTNWSVKLEYDYMDFGHRSVFLDDGLGNFFTEDIRQNMQMLKGGVNYRLNWGGQPAAASAYAYQGQPAHRHVHHRVHPGMPAAVDGDDEDDEAPSHVIPFIGTDVTKSSFFGWAGGLIAPWGDLDTSGPRVWIFGGSGLYKYSGGGTDFKGTFSTGDILAGYAFEGDNYSMNLLEGFSAANHMITPFDPDNSVQGTAGGIKVRGDLLVNPTPQTLTYGEAEYSTAFRTFYLSSKIGYDISNGKQIFVGPQAAFLGDERSTQWRVGAHITGLQIQKVQIDLAGGFLRDTVTGDSLYSRVEVNTHF